MRYYPIDDWGAVYNLILWLQMLRQQCRQRDGNGNNYNGGHVLHMRRQQQKRRNGDGNGDGNDG